MMRKKEEISLSPLTKNPFTNKNVKRATYNTKTSPRRSIRQRLRTDLGRSDGVTIVIQLVWLTSLRAQLSDSPQQLCNQKDTRLNICI